jgi:hypothetical protein
MKSRPIYQSRASAALTLTNMRSAYRRRDHKAFQWYFSYIPGLYMADLISEVAVRRAYSMCVTLDVKKLREGV